LQPSISWRLLQLAQSLKASSNQENMHLKNPFIFPIIFTIIIVLLLTYLLYKNFIQSAGAIFLQYENTSNIEKISLSENSSFQTVSIVAEDLKVPFFGTAFHINYNPQNYIYDHFTLGDFFSSDDDPLVLVNQKDSKIIVGISLKRGQLLTKSEGTLLKLYFKNDSPSALLNPNNDFSFSNAIFSTFDKQKGERQDIQNITFNP
jgi:hypothetical protein